jgi:signal transduction histidine kinase
VVLRNLIANALEAARHDGAADAWVRVEATQHHHHAAVAVLDSGPGIAADDVAQVFDSRQSSKPGGMGVGLAISRSIVEAHGGRMWVEPGPGGRFHFTLPLSGDPRHE